MNVRPLSECTRTVLVAGMPVQIVDDMAADRLPTRRSLSTLEWDALLSREDSEKLRAAGVFALPLYATEVAACGITFTELQGRMAQEDNEPGPQGSSAPHTHLSSLRGRPAEPLADALGGGPSASPGVGA